MGTGLTLCVNFTLGTIRCFPLFYDHCKVSCEQRKQQIIPDVKLYHNLNYKRYLGVKYL